jgi:hypothetical protein
VKHRELVELHARIAAYIQRHPDQTYVEMSRELGISIPTLSAIAIKHGITRGNCRYQSDAALREKLER